MKNRSLRITLSAFIVLTSFFLAGSMRKRPQHAELRPVEQAVQLFLRDLPEGENTADWARFARENALFCFQADQHSDK